MRVIDHIRNAGKPWVSFEIIPPTRGGDIQGLEQVVEDLVRYRPPFIDVTSHAAVVVETSTSEGVRQQYVRKRPGTLGICALIQRKYGVDAVPHVLCKGFSREETEDFLLELHYLGIGNVLALQGDDPGYEKQLRNGRSANSRAIDLVGQITSLRQGKYLGAEGTSMNFCVGVAGYPEKHKDAPSLEEDIRHLNEKVEAGAEYVVTQMFFDTGSYFSFVQRCRGAGITVPIVPGLKVMTSPKQLETLASRFSVSIPEQLRQAMKRTETKQEALGVGIRWAASQVKELWSGGVHGVHFYTMLDARPVSEVLGEVDYTP